MCADQRNTYSSHEVHTLAWNTYSALDCTEMLTTDEPIASGAPMILAVTGTQTRSVSNR